MATADKPPPTAADRRYRLLVALALVLAAAAMAVAVAATNTGDQDDPASVSAAPEVVEHLVPPAGSEQLRQSEIGIDLAPGYEAALIVDGVAIPTDQLREVPEQGQVFFTPGKGKVIEELEGGQVCVVAIAWKSSVGRSAQDQPFQWCFDVT